MSSRFHHRSGVSAVSLAVITALLVSSLTSCSTPQGVGEIREVDGGYQIIVPALWANPESGAGGVEPATVWVDTDREEGQHSYDLNLNDVQAKGGGPEWQAATSSAAFLGTLLSGFDPNDVACAFDITGPIDGPSAGALLTLGVLAAFDRQSIDPQVTMTGTISPDGSIGPVGLVSSKLEAAAREGFQTVVLPASQTKIADPETGEPLETRSFAQSLGIDVFFVRSIDEAYKEFTGHSLKHFSTDQKFMTADFEGLARAEGQAAIALSDEINTRMSMLNQPSSDLVNLVASATTASNGADPITSFALGVEALNQIAEQAAEQKYSETREARGDEVAQQELVTSVAESQALIEEELDEALTSVETFGSSQILSLPGALGWLTYGQAVLSALDAALDTPNLHPELVLSYARLASKVTSEALVVFPLEMSVLESVPLDDLTNSRTVNEFISGYTEFLVKAGNANVTYIHDVLGLTEKNTEMPVTDLIPVAEQLAEEAKSIDPNIGTLAEEIQESSIAMTLYVATTSLISSLQVFGSTGFWLDPEQSWIRGDDYIAESIDQSTALIQSYADYLLQEDMNAGLPVWSSQWGNAAFDEFSGGDLKAAGASIALHELWFDVITVLSMNSFTSRN